MKTSKKIPKTFFSFLTISALIWLLITFSKEYTTVITFPVNYKNIAQNQLLQEAPVKEIDITVKATGFKITGAKIRNKTIQLDASQLNRKHKDKFYILPNNQKNKIQNQLLSGIDIKEVGIDTIFLNLGLLTSKNVALQPNLDINYHVGYDLLGDISIEPDSILISGPKSTVDTIKYIRLNKLILSDVKANFSQEVEIVKIISQRSLNFNITKTKISGRVDKFTEGRIQVPFDIVNLPENINLTTLNRKVEIVFTVALSNFAKVSEASFKVDCDYSVAEKNNLGYLLPRIIVKPNFVKNLKIVPSKIDFLIQK
ncbi:MAG: YbbR-like domain-containing protein [Polaribacter sp.]|nr:YbbR-like domain-containing protein [Polaribacter sp.]